MAARAEASGGGLKNNAGTLRIVGVVALALTAVGIGAVRMGWGPFAKNAADETVLSKTAEPVPAPVTTAAPTAGTADLDAPALEPGAGKSAAPGKRAGARVASASGSGVTAVSAVTPDAKSTAKLTQLDEHVTYQYNAIGRRDPFQSLLTGEFVGNDVGGDAPPDPGGMRVVGIVWGASDRFAMVEDVRGNSYVLRKGDKVQNGYVEALRRDAVVIVVTADGQSQQVVIPFVLKGEGNGR
jgi:hypothetical protein